jgi:hypothetical protein
VTTGHAAKEFCRVALNYGSGPQTEIPIYDARTSDLPGWEECGFELLSHTSAVTDWRDEDEIARVHYPENTALVKQVTGCDHASYRATSGAVRRKQGATPISHPSRSCTPTSAG